MALRFAAVAEHGVSVGDDPFVKIKGLIFDLASKLERRLKKTAEKVYCEEDIGADEEGSNADFAFFDIVVFCEHVVSLKRKHHVDVHGSHLHIFTMKY